MNYEVYQVKFNIDIHNLIMTYNNNTYKYTILNLLGKGRTASVYLIESNNNFYIIKISDNNNNYLLKEEIQTLTRYFKKYNIKHNSYPKYHGEIVNLDGYGIIYPYLGFYNLKSIKKTSYIIEYKQKILIIRQLIEQLKIMNGCIHCDIKSENIVINIKLSGIIATIIDFGIMKDKTDNIFSVSYITSPESLLTLKELKYLVLETDNIDYTKHDYYGLFSVIIDLFLDKSIWRYFMKYFDIIGLDGEKLEFYFVYCWYRFFYNNIDELPNETFKKLINTIEINYINKNLDFITFDVFIDILDFKDDNIKDFLRKLIHFNPNERASLDDLLNHSFLII
jgi:serine/threonine protein kinase